MSKLSDEMAADFRQLHEELPAQVNLGGQTLHALVGENSLGEVLDAGGLLPERSLSVKLLKADLDQRPQVGQTLTCDGIRYRISSVGSKPGLPFVNLECQRL